MSLRHAVAAVVPSATFLTACGGGSGSKSPALPPVGTKGWTVLVYMTADINLEGDALKGLAEMASIDSGADLRFVVQADRAAVQTAVLYERDGTAKAGSYGLSTYFPPDSAFYDARYDTLAGMASWRTFLTAVHGGGTAQAAPAFDPAIPLTEIVAVAGHTFSGTITAATASSVSRAYLRYGLDVGGTPATAGGAILLGDHPATATGSTWQSTWDWTIPVIAQGTYQALGYLSFEQVSANLYTASFSLNCQASTGAPLEPAVWQISVDGTLPLTVGFAAAPSTYKYATVLRAENSAGEGAWACSWNIIRP